MTSLLKRLWTWRHWMWRRASKRRRFVQTVCLVRRDNGRLQTCPTPDRIERPVNDADDCLLAISCSKFTWQNLIVGTPTRVSLSLKRTLSLSLSFSQVHPFTYTHCLTKPFRHVHPLTAQALTHTTPKSIHFLTHSYTHSFKWTQMYFFISTNSLSYLLHI